MNQEKLEKDGPKTSPKEHLETDLRGTIKFIFAKLKPKTMRAFPAPILETWGRKGHGWLDLTMVTTTISCMILGKLLNSSGSQDYIRQHRVSKMLGIIFIIMMISEM